MTKRTEVDTTDLEKCFQVALDRISNFSDPDQKSSIIVLGAAGGRIDHTYAAYSNVFKYLREFGDQFLQIFMLSKSSMSVYLKSGMNKIITTSKWKNNEYLEKK